MITNSQARGRGGGGGGGVGVGVGVMVVLDDFPASKYYIIWGLNQEIKGVFPLMFCNRTLKMK